jgi:hypothetical protein
MVQPSSKITEGPNAASHTEFRRLYKKWDRHVRAYITFHSSSHFLSHTFKTVYPIFPCPPPNTVVLSVDKRCSKRRLAPVWDRAAVEQMSGIQKRGKHASHQKSVDGVLSRPVGLVLFCIWPRNMGQCSHLGNRPFGSGCAGCESRSLGCFIAAPAGDRNRIRWIRAGPAGTAWHWVRDQGDSSGFPVREDRRRGR